MNRSLLDDWSYDRVMLQLLGTAGTVNNITLRYMNHLLVRYQGVKNKCLLLTAGQISYDLGLGRVLVLEKPDSSPAEYQQGKFRITNKSFNQRDSSYFVVSTLVSQPTFDT